MEQPTTQRDRLTIYIHVFKKRLNETSEEPKMCVIKNCN